MTGEKNDRRTKTNAWKKVANGKEVQVLNGLLEKNAELPKTIIGTPNRHCISSARTFYPFLSALTVRACVYQPEDLRKARLFILQFEWCVFLS